MAKHSIQVYKLSRELFGHIDEVRSLAIFKNGNIVSTSRDKTSRLWIANEGNFYLESISMEGHSDFVCSVCTIEPSSKNPKGFIVTGSYDNNICIYYPGEKTPVHKVKAHENTVCGLRASAVDKESFLSCSSDHTGKLWNLYDLAKPKAIYSDLNINTIIWCIVDLPNGSVVTGGSDKNVIVYSRDGKILQKLNGHLDCIRDIVAINENEFLTCGNDAITKHWNAVSGICLGTYHGHTSHIYSISAVLGGNLAASCGEDRTIKIWRYGQIDQSIVIPAETIWCVRFLPNEDIVCGSSDGIVRIFTTNEKRYIRPKAMEKFEEAVLNSVKNYDELNKDNEVDINNLSHTGELNQPGEKDGETIIVKEIGEVKAYRWSERDFQWKLIGDVVKSEVENSGKQIFNGVQYDYIFSVDIEKGTPLLKLPYNKGQDPYVVALQFIEDNDLNPKYLDQVANFIVTNLQLSPILNAESQNQNQFRSFQPTTPIGQNNYIPQTKYLKVEQGNVLVIYEKLKEFNLNTENGVLSIPLDKLESLKILFSKENSGIIDEEINHLKSLLNWPDNVVFPVLDIARLAVLQKNVNQHFCTNGIFNVLKRHIQKDALASNQMLTFRLLANLFYHETGEGFCLRCKDEVLSAICDFSVIENKNNQIAVSTYILNLVVALNRTNDFLGKVQTLSVIFKLLEILKETEAVFRILIGLGTIIMGATNDNEREEFIKSVKLSRPVLKALRLLLDSVDSSNVPDKLLSVTRQILEIIKR